MFIITIHHHSISKKAVLASGSGPLAPELDGIQHAVLVLLGRNMARVALCVR